MREILGIIGQWCGLLAVATGIACEIIFKADVYLIVITAGSTLFAVATKLRGR